MNTEDVWEKILVPLIIGPIFIIIKVLYDRWDFKKTQTKMLLNKLKLEKITNKLEKFYWPLYILLINDYDLWAKVKFDENSIEITESASDSEVDNVDMDYKFCSFSRKTGENLEKCSNPVAVNCIDKYGAYCIKHQQFKSKKVLENWTILYDKVNLLTKKETNIVDYNDIKQKSIKLKNNTLNESSNTDTKIDIPVKNTIVLENIVDNISENISDNTTNNTANNTANNISTLNSETVFNNTTINNICKSSSEESFKSSILLDINDKTSKCSSYSIEGLIDKNSNRSNELDIKSKMLDELLKHIVENHTKIAIIITENIYIAEPKSLMGKQLMKFIKFINIFKSEMDSQIKLINPCNYGAGYPKKLLPLVEREVFKLQKQYNELINNFYNY